MGRGSCVRRRAGTAHAVIHSPQQPRATSVGAVRLRAPPFLVMSVEVSACRCEPLRAGCCGGKRVLDVS